MNNILRKELLVVALFLFVIVLPVSDMVMKLDRFKYLNENRELAKSPQFSFTFSGIQKFPVAYTNYFNDHFGFRNSLVRVNFIMRHNLLRISPSKQVIIGKNGWLFYTGEGEIEDYRGITKYDDKTLEKWARTLEMKRIWLEKQGIRYLFVVAPNKSTIYGEFLPDSYNRVREKTGLDELVEYLKKHTQVKVVDIRNALFEEKSKGRVYQKKDTHWNEYGGFIAYRQIIKPIIEWFPTSRMQTFDDYHIEKKMGGGGDITYMIGGTEFIKEEHIKFKPKDNHSLSIEGINDITKSPVTVQHDNSSLPRALIFRDSYFTWVAPFLAEHFQVSKFYWQYWNSLTPIEEMINDQKPDIVIEEIVERLVKTRMTDFTATPPVFLSK